MTSYLLSGLDEVDGVSKNSHMANLPSSPEFSLRRATQADADTIRKIISSVHINPMSLNWQHFILAVTRQGILSGAGRSNNMEMAQVSWPRSPCCLNGAVRVLQG